MKSAENHSALDPSRSAPLKGHQHLTQLQGNTERREELEKA